MEEVRFQSKLIVFDHEGKILVLRRSPQDFRRPKEWDLPGGGVNKNETFEQAAQRELKEETGIDAVIGSQDIVFACSKAFSNGPAVTWFFYALQIMNPAISLSSEHTDVRFLTLEQAEHYINYDIQLQAIKYIAQKGFADRHLHLK